MSRRYSVVSCSGSGQRLPARTPRKSRATTGARSDEDPPRWGVIVRFEIRSYLVWYSRVRGSTRSIRSSPLSKMAPSTFLIPRSKVAAQTDAKPAPREDCR